jgi:hypothetical protein
VSLTTTLLLHHEPVSVRSLFGAVAADRHAARRAEALRSKAGAARELRLGKTDAVHAPKPKYRKQPHAKYWFNIFPKFESYRSVTTTNNNRHSGARVTREARHPE